MIYVFGEARLTSRVCCHFKIHFKSSQLNIKDYYVRSECNGMLCMSHQLARPSDASSPGVARLLFVKLLNLSKGVCHWSRVVVVAAR